MKNIKNLPDYPEYLKELIIAASHTVSSRKIITGIKCDITLLAFGEGEDKCEMCHSGEAMYLCVEGTATIKMDDTDYKIKEGQLMTIEAGMQHIICGNSDYKLLQILTE